MSIAGSLLSEFDEEMEGTRRVLDRIPDEGLDWRPHPKSMSLEGLAAHLAAAPAWILPILEQPGLDLAAPRPAPVTGRQAILDLFASNVAAARKALAGTTDAGFADQWTLRAGPALLDARPRMEMYRRFGISHIVHHRAQLGVYLRLLDIPVPGVYGPSADER